jgi:hypothetical protein
MRRVRNHEPVFAYEGAHTRSTLSMGRALTGSDAFG